MSWIKQALLIVIFIIAFFYLSYVAEKTWNIAASAAGHPIGITGSILILVLMFYPVRKYLSSGPGRLRTWLSTHEYIGFIGPALVVIHIGFRFKALVATLSFALMIIVVISGTVGQYLVTQVRKELKGKKKELKQLGYTDGEVENEISTLVSTSSVMKNWRSLHFPITMTFVVVTIIHIVEVYYY